MVATLKKTVLCLGVADTLIILLSATLHLSNSIPGILLCSVSSIILFIISLGGKMKVNVYKVLSIDY